jgi:hypothetical protein
MNQPQKNMKVASLAAFISSGLFVALIVSFIVFPNFPLVTAYIGIAVHLLMLVVASALPAPELGRVD